MFVFTYTIRKSRLDTYLLRTRTRLLSFDIILDNELSCFSVGGFKFAFIQDFYECIIKVVCGHVMFGIRLEYFI